MNLETLSYRFYSKRSAPVSDPERLFRIQIWPAKKFRARQGQDRVSTVYGITVPVAHVLSVLHDGQLLVVSCLQFHVRVTAGPVPTNQREIQCCGPCGSGMILFRIRILLFSWFRILKMKFF
jgi:hypothetical protein